MPDELRERTKPYLSQAWEVITRLSDETLNTAREKAEQGKLDKNRGEVGLDESLINLVASRDLLKDAIEKNKLQQLPLSLQQKLFKDLEEVLESLMMMTNSGTDEIVVLTTRIEALNADIWRFGLHNLSSEVLGHQTKLNQLKHQETEILRLRDQIKESLEFRDSAHDALSEISSLQTNAVELKSSIATFAEEASSNAANVRQSSEKASAELASIQKVSEGSARLLADVTAAHGKVMSLEEATDKSSSGIAATRTALEALLSDSTQALQQNQADISALQAQTTQATTQLETTLTEKMNALLEDNKISLANSLEVAKNFHNEQLDMAKKQFDNLIDESTKENKFFLDVGKQDHADLKSELIELEEQIKDKIYQATGYTLFGAFQARQNKIAKAKRNWSIATLLCVLAALGVGWYVVHAIHSVQDVRFEFFAKLSLSLPIIYAIGFCSIQYSKERRLEEEYAFKSSVSVSLKPYQDLVAQLVNKTDPAESAKYTAFVINSVENVFSSPTDKVFETLHKDSGNISDSAIKQFAKLAEPLVQIATRK